MKRYDYDFIVLGGGAAGLVASKLALGLGKKIAIVEKNKIGGECTLTGCVPSKTLIKAAQVVHDASSIERFGIKGEFKFDASNVMDHVRSVVEQVYNTHTPEQLQSLGMDIIIGAPYFEDKNTLSVDGKKITSNKFLICTGSKPFIPPVGGIDSVSYLTNENIFDLKELPDSMVIMGGGPIGTEMASAFNYLGTKVTIVEMQERILHREDQELTSLLTDKFCEESIKVLTSTKVVGVKEGAVECETLGGEKINLSADKLLVAVGRLPNTDGLKLENARVKHDKTGINVNGKLQTTTRNIYACGDVVGPYLFSHMAEHQAMRATQNALIPFINKSFNYDHVPWVTFTNPELAATGLTEQSAVENYGSSIKIYKQSYAHVDRAITDRAEMGLAKFICDKKGNLLGAHILGARAGEVIHEPLLAKVEGINFSKLHWLIHPYPTYNEVVKKASRKCYIDLMRSNFFLNIAKKVFGGGKK